MQKQRLQPNMPWIILIIVVVLSTIAAYEVVNWANNVSDQRLKESNKLEDTLRSHNITIVTNLSFRQLPLTITLDNQNSFINIAIQLNATVVYKETAAFAANINTYYVFNSGYTIAYEWSVQ